MDTIKKLYALLIILLILYVGINVAADNIHLDDGSDSSSISKGKGATATNTTLPSLSSFNKTQINDTTVSYTDASHNMTIYVNKIDNSKELSDIIKGLNQAGYTSNQTITENGDTAYFLYKEDSESYSADIYFNKNNQNYLITGNNITYENSDYFISHCKSIINSMGSGNSTNGLTRW